MDRVSFLRLAYICLIVVSASADDHEINAIIGHNATLPCQAEGLMPFKVVEWSRMGTVSEYVVVFHKQNPEPETPEQSYKSRVELKDMQNGDVSLVLRNVTTEDSGRYECYVVKDTKRRKRDVKPFCTFYLGVAPPGHGHNGLILGLLLSVLLIVVFAVVSLAAVLKNTNKNASPPPPSPRPPHDEDVEISLV